MSDTAASNEAVNDENIENASVENVSNPAAAETPAVSTPADAPAPGATPSMPLRPRIPPPGIRVKKEVDGAGAAAEKPRRPRRGPGNAKRAGRPGERERGPRKPRSQEFKGDDNDIVTPKEPTDEDKAKRKERVVAAKDALARSVDVKGPHVAPARTALKEYLRNLNDPRQPNDDKFKLLIEAPFHAPPKPRSTGFGGGGGRR